MNVNWGFCVTQPLLWDSMGSPSYGSLWEAPQVSECIVWGYDKQLCNKCSIYSFRIRPSIHPSIYSAACLTIYPSIHPSIWQLSIYRSFHSSIHPFVGVSAPVDPSYGSLWEAPQVSECIVWGYEKPLCNPSLFIASG